MQPAFLEVIRGTYCAGVNLSVMRTQLIKCTGKLFFNVGMIIASVYTPDLLKILWLILHDSTPAEQTLPCFI